LPRWRRGTFTAATLKKKLGKDNAIRDRRRNARARLERVLAAF